MARTRHSRGLWSEIRIIGSRGVGKTTYLAALLRLPEELQRQFPGLMVKPGGEDADNLVMAAKNIIEQGAKLAATNLDEDPFFDFQITIPSANGLPGITLNLGAKDYPGEIFEWAASEHRWPSLEPYVDDWCTAQGWMIMLTDWRPDQDARLYEPALNRLLRSLSERAAINPKIKVRIALVMAKCERGELWPGRLDPREDLFKVRLPKTYRLLTENVSPEYLRFFACSAFGVLSDRVGDRDPRPNRYVPDDGSSAEFNAYLRDPGVWQPFGLISPIYWLSTGRLLRDERL